MAKKKMKLFIPGAIALDAASALFPIKELNFNIMTTLAFILPLVGGILALLFKNGLLAKIITTACFVVGAVFLFSTTGFISIGMEREVAKEIADSGYEIGLGAGPIVAGILSVLGALVCFFKGTIAKKFS